MNELVFNKPLTTHDLFDGDLLTMAKRELSAFFSAVTERFGSEQAETSAEDWFA